MPDLVEVILVELADEAGEVAMLEMFGQDGLGESLVLRRVKRRNHHLSVGPTSRTTKLSPSSPHRTTCEYDGSSSILHRISRVPHKLGSGTILVQLAYLGTVSKNLEPHAAGPHLQNH